MPVPPRRSIIPVLPVLLVLIGSLVALPVGLSVRGATGTHLLISEVVTGGASASDELIELYNPTAAPLPLEGLEVVYVSASGASISRRAAWAADAAPVPAGGHALLANEAGVYAGIADVLYASGLAASGGSVAIRIQGATSAIDAVGWGTTTSSWREGTATVVAASGASIERLPGGSLGSTQDTDDNASDFVERPVPDPQNLGSAPVPGGGPSAVPSPSATTAVSPVPTAVPTPPATSPMPTPGADPVTVAAARAATDGAAVTIEATALTASDHHDGGGFVADESGGIAVLLDAGSFQRGDLVRVHGTVDDRFSQRTLRANDAEAVVAGGGQPVGVASVATGAVGEPWEGRLVQVAGAILGATTELSTSLALDLDDGSGPLRVIILFSSGVDTSAWQAGARLELVGVVGQRDSSGSGTSGYRLMLRDAADVLAVQPPAQATPGPSSTTAASPGATPPEAEGVVTIAEARAAAKGDRVQVRGVVTMPPGIIDPVTAVIQDASGAIVLRLGDEVGPISPGQEIRVAGTRSTKAGMETLRVTEPPMESRQGGGPAARALRSGEAGELHEALLVVVRGALVANARRASSGSVTFEVDDGSGPLRVTLAASLEVDHAPLTAGTWVEVHGVLGQETTGAQPLRGYRVWPRDMSDLRITAEGTGAGAGSGDADEEDGPAGTSLGGLFTAGGVDTRVGATLVAGSWPKLGVAGVLWDGARVVVIDIASQPVVEAAIAGRPLPVPVELDAPRTVGTEPVTSASMIVLAPGSSGVHIAASRPAPPLSQLPAADEPPRWVSLVGTLNESRTVLLLPDGRSVALEHRCDETEPNLAASVGATGIGVGDPATLIVPCDGFRAAPGLARSATTARAPTGAGSDDRVLSSAAVAPPADRAMPAVLLLLASLVLLGAGFAGRYLGGLEPPSGPPSDTLAAEGQPTLISLVAEHAPERERAAYTPARSTEHEPRRRAPPS